MSKKALIIGAAGFVGGYLSEELLKNGYEVYLTKLEFEKIEKSAATVYNMDVTSVTETEAVIADIKPDVVFHLAAQSSVKLSWEKPYLTLNVNIIGALNVLEACRQLYDLGKKTKVLLIGSAEEYGKVTPEQCPINEELQCAPKNLYALSKLTQNGLGKIYSDAFGMDIITVRAFNHTGPKQAPAFVLADFCKQVAEIETGERDAVISVGNLEAMRDFTDVRDIVKAYLLLAEKGKSGQTYNVGRGDAVKISALLEMLLEQAKCPIEVRRDEGRMRPSDVPLHVADTSKIRNDTGWQPLISLEETVKDTLDYWRQVAQNKQ